MKRTITQQMTLGATTRSPHHRPCENKNKNDNLHDTDLDPIEKQRDNLANGCIASDIVDTGVWNYLHDNFDNLGTWIYNLGNVWPEKYAQLVISLKRWTAEEPKLT